jgi:hypothetical protein
MSLLLSVRKRLILSVLLAAFPTLVWAEISAIPQQANESSLAGSLAGDQVHSSLSLNQNGGYSVWEENGSVKTGTEIKAARLNSSFTKISTFTINKIAKGDQKNPQVQLLNFGDAIFVWQGYGLGNADIYARILKDDGSFATSDLRVNSNSKPKGSYSKDQQSEPAVTALNDGGAFVAWQSLGQDGSMMGIYARVISSAGSMATNEFLVNQTTDYNQRSPAVATLANGNVIVAWISEFQRFGSSFDLSGAVSIDVYARIFDATGNPLSEEKLLNAGNNMCANPAIAALPNGGFTVVWSEKDALSRSNSWEIMGRNFSSEGDATGADFKINSNTYGDQYRPKIAAVGNNCAVVWTSLGQDGSREGVFGRILQSGTQPSGGELPINNRTVSQQIHPVIAANGSDRFFVSWSSFVATTGFDLFSRKYILNQQ